MFRNLTLAFSEIQQWKRLSHLLLHVSRGDRVLDIGCGTGADAIALAPRVGTKGRVVGVDPDAIRIAIARSSAESLRIPVTFQRADIHELPFADGSFTHSRLDRMLHSFSDLGIALREAMRVTVAGGRFVLIEPDWRTLTIAGGDPKVTPAVLDAARNVAPTPAFGSDLRCRLSAIGLHVLERHYFELELRDFAIARALFSLETLLARASASHVTVAEAERWLRSLQFASATGTFRCTLGSVTVLAMKSANFPR
ncbi:methyltransferase domain-containing protein [Pendulispora brunnea]|uniref:Methyltransferase domain-containing protein n=1 Tax=Pendulispora brunnea TaxID=2905690 RepID=A0ABZ2KEV1_9BACT